MCVKEQDARGLDVSDRDRRRGDQPRVRPAHRVRRRRPRSSSRACSTRRTRSKGSTSWTGSTGIRRKRARRSARSMRDEARAPRANDRARPPRRRPDGRTARADSAHGGRSAAAVLRRAHGRRRRRARALAASISRASTGFRGAARTPKATQWEALVRDEFEPRLAALSAPGRSASRCSRRGRSTGTSRPPGTATTSSSTIPPIRARDRALRVHAPGRRRASVPGRLSARAGDGGRERRHRAASRDGRRRPSRSGSTRCSSAATTANRTFCTASPCSRPRRWPNTRTAAFAANSGSSRIAENATRGATARVPISSQHEIVWRLLDVERAIGAALTAAFQIVPEQSTAAIIIHHPQATYFNAAARGSWRRSNRGQRSAARAGRVSRCWGRGCRCPRV